MFIKIILAIVLILLLFLVFVATRPADFRISRSTLVSTPAAVVFAEVNDFHQWEAWSPWAKMDPNCKVVFEGPAKGEGAVFRWAGNNQVGEGSNTITETRPDEKILIRLEFLKPFKATNTAEFTFVPEGAQTRVTWSMSGTNGFMGKLMGIIMNCDKMVGGQFEQGLASLKSIAENKIKP